LVSEDLIASTMKFCIEGSWPRTVAFFNDTATTEIYTPFSSSVSSQPVNSFQLLKVRASIAPLR
jgi:hypothetical protein